MVTPAAGEIVLVPFPFSDLSQSKVRPAVCLAHAGRGDWILRQITSKPYGDPYAILLNARHFASGDVLVSSYARPGKLFTANEKLLLRTVGKLNGRALKRVVDVVVKLLRRRRNP